MKKTIDYIVIRFYKTALNLIIVDFECIQKAIHEDYYKQLSSWGVLEEDIKNREVLRLKLFLYIKHTSDFLQNNNNNKNVIFYTNQLAAKHYLDIIANYFPFIVYYNESEFNGIFNDCGESREILEEIKALRYNFDYSKFPKRLQEKFYLKYKIQQI